MKNSLLKKNHFYIATTIPTKHLSGAAARGRLNRPLSAKVVGLGGKWGPSEPAGWRTTIKTLNYPRKTHKVK
jgi:hypothetical protein